MHRAGALTSPSWPRRVGGVSEQHVEEPAGGGGFQPGRCCIRQGGMGHGNLGEVRQLKRNLSYAMSKATRKSEELVALKKVN